VPRGISIALRAVTIWFCSEASQEALQIGFSSWVNVEEGVFALKSKAKTA
jgi:hypothetical protein